MPEVRIGPQGRLVVPAQLRKELGIHTGERLVAHVEDGRLILERHQQGRYSQVLLALEAFSKKTQRTPPPKIELAEKRLADWRSRQRSRTK